MPKRWSIMAAPLAIGVMALLASCSGIAGSPVGSDPSGGWSASARLAPTTAKAGTPVSIAVTVASSSTLTGLVDVVIYDPRGTRVHQAFWDRQSFLASQARTFAANWAVPGAAFPGVYTVKVGVFTAGWGRMRYWNNGAATFAVDARSSAPDSIPAPSSGSAQPNTTSDRPHFSTLPPGSPLPSDQTCASEVQPTPEVRPRNAHFNATAGIQKHLAGPYSTFSRVDGNFTGTTDEILQWVACKWGIDEDVVRAQAAVESWWNMTNLGDWTSDATLCAPNHPIGSDPSHPGHCPESVGILQDRYAYTKNGFNQVETSTAYNADYVYAAWRACYNGEETWLNTVSHLGTYGAGDLWGCVGVWYSGRWHTSPAEAYISKVQSYLNSKIWTQPDFRSYP